MPKIEGVSGVNSWKSGAPPPARRARTPVWKPDRVPTWCAPKSDPLGRQRAEGWDIFSRDGQWHYERQDDGGRTMWAIIFRPTGQRREFFSNILDAREVTAAGLLHQLRGEAKRAALHSPMSTEERAAGQRWLAVHLRISGMVQGSEAEHRCRCGGFLAVVTETGDLGHLDACDHCYTYGSGLPTKLCPHAERHRMCSDPLVAGSQHGCGLWRTGCCATDCRPPA